MNTARDLLADLRSSGIELHTDGSRIRWRPTSMVSVPLAERIAANSFELITLVNRNESTPDCPRCAWPLDSLGRCPKCFDRSCVDCGKSTGSYLIQRCVACGYFLNDTTS